MDMEFLGEVLNNWNLYFSPYVVNFLNWSTCDDEIIPWNATQ
jgi:hypothetical protein